MKFSFSGKPCMRSASTIAALLLVGSIAGAYEPTSRYEVKGVEGWQVYVHRDLLPGGKERENGEPALRQLRYGLAKTKQMVTDAPLEKLQRVKIWLEVDSTNGPHGRTPAYHYHPGLDWLVKMDYHPGKHKCVEFGKAEGLAKRSDFKSVQVTMHELAHAYHDQVLGFDDPDVLAAHKRAREDGKYPAGDWVVRADHKEFFAGLTTRYFESEERRKEIVERDPIFAKKLEEYWGSPKALMHDPLAASTVGAPENADAGEKLPIKIYFSDLGVPELPVLIVQINDGCWDGLPNRGGTVLRPVQQKVADADPLDERRSRESLAGIEEANHIVRAAENVPLTLGGLIDRDGHFQIFDELAIWRRAITPDEVGALYNNGFGAEIISGNVKP